MDFKKLFTTCIMNKGSVSGIIKNTYKSIRKKQRTQEIKGKYLSRQLTEEEYRELVFMAVGNAA